MFGLTTATRVFVAPGATDMRKGFDGLFGLVRDALGEDPLSGHLFLFANRDRTRVKVLVLEFQSSVAIHAQISACKASKD